MLREAKRRRRLEQNQRLAVEKKVRARAREEAARDRRLAAAPIEPPPKRPSEYAAWLDRRDAPRGLASANSRSQNDELAADTVAAGGGIQELIEVTRLRTRRNVYEAIDPQIVNRALNNDRKRPEEQPSARRYRRFTPDDALIARRAAGEPLRRLATDSGVSHSTLCRSFARSDIEAEVQAAKQHLLDEQQRQATEQARLADLAAHYASKVPHIWCPIHYKRVFVTSIDTSEDPRLHVSGCCQEAINELLRWLKIYRPPLPEDS